MKSVISLLTMFVFFFIQVSDAEARRRKRRRKPRVSVTHPIYFWGKEVVSDKLDFETRKKAAFKLSQYTQPIFQGKVIESLLTCASDKSVPIRRFCTIGLGNVRSKRKADSVNRKLASNYREFPKIKDATIDSLRERNYYDKSLYQDMVRNFDQLPSRDAKLAALNYINDHSSGKVKTLNHLIRAYHKESHSKVQRGIVDVLASKGKGQQPLLNLFNKCTAADDTPLVLTCLGALESQSSGEPATWSALESSIQSNDPDVIEATLDVINSLNEKPNSVITLRITEILNEVDDPEVSEKATIALLNSGDTSTVDLVSLYEDYIANETLFEGVRIAAALNLGKQGVSQKEKSLSILKGCKKVKSQSIRTACDLSYQELKKS